MGPMRRLLPVRSYRMTVLLIVLVLAVWANLGTAPNSPFVPSTKPPPRYTDVRLYADVVSEVRQGKNYYETSTRLQRTHNYPVRPFFTVRPPLLAQASAWFGDLLWPGCVLLTLCSLVWLHSLAQRSILERIAALFALLASGLPLVLSPFRGMHEVWGGLFAALALGLDAARLSVVPAMLAVLVRELNFPLLGLFVFGRRHRISALVGIVICAAALLIHRQAVLAWTLPTDLSSQGWLGLRGPAGWVDDLSRNTVLQFLPRPLAALLAFAPLLGWAELGRFRALAWFSWMFAMVAVFARPDNTYWCLGVLPVWFVGLAFVTAFLHSLARRADRVTASPEPVLSTT